MKQYSQYSLVLLLIIFGGCTANLEKDRVTLLELQDVQQRAHLEKNPHLLTEMFSADFYDISKGKVNMPSKNESLNRFKGYFNSVEFIKWDNIQNPIIKISKDGTMAFIIVQKLVHIEFVSNGELKESITEFAWLETWEKVDGEWNLSAIASTTSAK